MQAYTIVEKRIHENSASNSNSLMEIRYFRQNDNIDTFWVAPAATNPVAFFPVEFR